MNQCNLDQLASSVLSSDMYQGGGVKPLVKHTLEVAFLKIGLAALSDSFSISLDNGYRLTCKTLGEHEQPAFDLLSHLKRQREFSERTFGPGDRTEGVVDHIRKELNEVLSNPSDVNEWIDVVILALDGAWRIGAGPQEIIAALVAKQTKNEGRKWPDWRTAAPDKAIEHIKTPCGVCNPNGVFRYGMDDRCPECGGKGFIEGV